MQLLAGSLLRKPAALSPTPILETGTQLSKAENILLFERLQQRINTTLSKKCGKMSKVVSNSTRSRLSSRHHRHHPHWFHQHHRLFLQKQHNGDETSLVISQYLNRHTSTLFEKTVEFSNICQIISRTRDSLLHEIIFLMHHGVASIQALYLFGGSDVYPSFPLSLHLFKPCQTSQYFRPTSIHRCWSVCYVFGSIVNPSLVISLSIHFTQPRGFKQEFF